MSKVAVTSGGAGDIVYSIPVLKKLNVDTIGIKASPYNTHNGNLFTTIAPLLTSQGFKVFHTSPCYPLGVFEPGIKYDYNLDLFREQPYRGRNHIIKSYEQQFNVSLFNWKKPWLNVKGSFVKLSRPYNLIHLTPRWRDNSKVNWATVLKHMDVQTWFIGFADEWESFCQYYGDVAYLATSNLLEMAQVIRHCEALYCNQSVALTLAQGLGKKYFLEVKPNKTNTLMYTPNENIL